MYIYVHVYRQIEICIYQRLLRAGIFYILYETKKKADYTLFNSEVAKKIKEVEDIAVKDKDFEKWCMRYDRLHHVQCPRTPV